MAVAGEGVDGRSADTVFWFDVEGWHGLFRRGAVLVTGGWVVVR